MGLLKSDDAAAFHERPGGVDHHTTELHDGDVARPESFAGAIGDRPHRKPHSDILVGNSLDARKVAKLHRLAVLAIVVFRGAQNRSIILIEVDADLRVEKLPPSFLVNSSAWLIAPGHKVEITAHIVFR